MKAQPAALHPSISTTPYAASTTPYAAAVFFTREIIWLTPGDLGRFQLQRHLLAETEGGLGTFLQHPLVLTIGALERRLLEELPRPELDELGYRLLLDDLAGPLVRLLLPASAAAAGAGENWLKIKAALAADLEDGLGRLKLAGLSWDQVAELPPRRLGRTLAALGRRHDEFLAARGRLDRSARRRLLLERLRTGLPFKTLAGTRRLIYRQAQRLSPFETELLLALAAVTEVEVTLTVPAWVRDENIDHGSGFDLLRAIRRMEADPAPGLNLEFIAPAESQTSPALAYAAEFLLAPPAGRPPAPDPAGAIRLVKTPTAYHEVEEAARRLKRLVAGGQDPSNLALVAPSLDDYGPLVDDVGRRFGLAFHFRRGRTLAEQGPARTALDLLALWDSHWERTRVLDLARSPYFKMLDLDNQVDLSRLTLSAGVTDRRAGGGFEDNLSRWLQAPGRPEEERAVRALLDLLGRLRAAGAELAAAAAWPSLIGRFKALLAELGWPGAAAEPAELAGPDMAAARSFQEALDSLEKALTVGPAPPVGLSLFRWWLTAVVSDRRLPDGRGPNGRVWVLNYYDLHGGCFEEIFFLGLNERVFPRTGPENHWWPPEFAAAAAGREFLGRALWSDAADRYRQQEMSLAAGLGQARRRVWLFHHAGDESGRPALPSPLLTALLDLWPDGHDGSRLTVESPTWRPAPDPAEAAGPDELWVGLARLDPAHWPSAAPRDEENLRLWAGLRRRRELWVRLRREVRPGPAAVGRWLAARPRHLGAPLLRPSFLAGFAECPLAFWFREALGLASDGEPAEEWSPTSEGDCLHRVLENFFRRRLGPDGAPGPPWPGSADEAKCRTELWALAQAEAARVHSGPLGRRPLWRLRQEALRDLLAGWLRRELAVGRPEARPWRLEWSFGPGLRDAAPPWPLAVDEVETIYFHGRVDRIDQTERGLWVRDYKRRDDPAGFRVSDKSRELPPRAWPLLLYALAAGEHFGQPAACSFEIIDPGADQNQRLGLSSDHPALDADPAVRAQRWAAGELSFPQLLAETWAAVRAGVFPVTGSATAVCRYCPFPALCPRVDAPAEEGPA